MADSTRPGGHAARRAVCPSQLWHSVRLVLVLHDAFFLLADSKATDLRSVVGHKQFRAKRPAHRTDGPPKARRPWRRGGGAPEGRMECSTPNLPHWLAVVSWLVPPQTNRRLQSMIRMRPDHRQLAMQTAPPPPTAFLFSTPGSIPYLQCLPRVWDLPARRLGGRRRRGRLLEVSKTREPRSTLGVCASRNPSNSIETKVRAGRSYAQSPAGSQTTMLSVWLEEPVLPACRPFIVPAVANDATAAPERH
ncbi:hypothetical protein GQ53DRAFT_330836 [Thozetella sp. PMI_491]|nr:hypothetical protein GQ53DRAFT_330836 [Thozetella sp. PMI_491]